MNYQPTSADIAWAEKYGWEWTGFSFVPFSTIRVIPNPMHHQHPGWTPWLAACGAIQTEAPFGSVRAAIRVAEGIRQQRSLGPDEMPCSDK